MESSTHETKIQKEIMDGIQCILLPSLDSCVFTFSRALCYGGGGHIKPLPTWSPSVLTLDTANKNTGKERARTHLQTKTRVVGPTTYNRGRRQPENSVRWASPALDSWGSGNHPDAVSAALEPAGTGRGRPAHSGPAFPPIPQAPSWAPAWAPAEPWATRTGLGRQLDGARSLPFVPARSRRPSGGVLTAGGHRSPALPRSPGGTERIWGAPATHGLPASALPPGAFQGLPGPDPGCRSPNPPPASEHWGLQPPARLPGSPGGRDPNPRSKCPTSRASAEDRKKSKVKLPRQVALFCANRGLPFLATAACEDRKG